MARPGKYQRITREDRLKLIKMVKNEKMSMKSAANKLNISSSTARVIVKSFEEQGKIFESSNLRKQRLIREENEMENNLDDAQPERTQESKEEYQK